MIIMRKFDTDAFIGMHYGDLTVMKCVGTKEYGKTNIKKLYMYECECKCGNHIVVPLQYPKSGAVTRCKECKENAYKEKWIGQRFGDYIVLDVVEKAHKDEEGFHNMKLRVKNNLDNSEHVLYLPNLKKLQKKNA